MWANAAPGILDFERNTAPCNALEERCERAGGAWPERKTRKRSVTPANDPAAFGSSCQPVHVTGSV